jgi:hypothetical protein
LAALSNGALLAPDHAVVLGPDIATWLDSLTSGGASEAAAVGGRVELQGANAPDLSST